MPQLFLLRHCKVMVVTGSVLHAAGYLSIVTTGRFVQEMV